MSKAKHPICIISFPIGKAFVVPLSHLGEVAQGVAPHPCIITAHTGDSYFESGQNHFSVKELNYESSGSQFRSIFSYLSLQIRVSREVIARTRQTRQYWFFMEAPPLLPMLAAKVTGKKCLWMLPSQIVLTGDSKNNSFGLKLLNPARKLCYLICDRIVVYSARLVKEWKLEKYRRKISLAHEHFLDFKEFSPRTELYRRKKVVGFIGRLSREKGILNFIQAIAQVAQNRRDIEFLVGGDGPLKTEIYRYIDEHDLRGRVITREWIDHKDLPEYLNQLRLMVIPSYTEGLPNILLEALACGTPVLAAATGAIPDYLREGENGFLLEDNRPDSIAAAIIRAVDHSELEQVAQQGRVEVLEKFSREQAVRDFQRILGEI